MLTVVSGSSKTLLARVAQLKERLSVLEGVETRKTRALSSKVFGKGLSPLESVQTIVADVRARRDEALAEWTAKLDGVTIPPGAFRFTVSLSTSSSWFKMGDSFIHDSSDYPHKRNFSVIL